MRGGRPRRGSGHCATGSRAGGRASEPGTTPSRGSPRRRARQRAGTSFWGATKPQVRLRQIRRRTAEDLVLPLEQPDPLLQLPRLGGLVCRLTGTVAFLDICLAEPVLQRRLADSEVSGDLLDGDAALTAASNRNDVLAELSRIGTGHDDLLPVSASRH